MILACRYIQGIVLIVNWDTSAQPTVGGSIPWAGGPGLYKKLVNREPWNISPWFLLQVSDLTSLSDGLQPGSVNQIDPFLLQIAFGQCFTTARERKLQHSPTHIIMVPTENNLTLLVYLNGLFFQPRYQTLALFSDTFSGPDPTSFALREIIRSRPRSLLCWQLFLWDKPRFIFPSAFGTIRLPHSLNLEIWMVPLPGYFLRMSPRVHLVPRCPIFNHLFPTSCFPARWMHIAWVKQQWALCTVLGSACLVCSDPSQNVPGSL